MSSSSLTIAIDGHSGCGKSTTAKGVSQKLGYLYIDSGAMYRAITFYCLRHHIPCDRETPELEQALQDIHLNFVENPATRLPEITLNDEIMEPYIRTPEVAAQVSPVATLHIVREAMVAQQQKIGAKGGIVMDGRDIGTVVFPHAEIKVFMTAKVAVRAARRQKELADKGIVQSLEEIMHNLTERDRIDSSRAESPLRKAIDAHEIDTGTLTIDEQIAQVLSWVEAYEKR